MQESALRVNWIVDSRGGAETEKRGKESYKGKDRRDESDKLHRAISDEKFLAGIEVDCFRDGLWFGGRAHWWDVVGDCRMAII